MKDKFCLNKKSAFIGLIGFLFVITYIFLLRTIISTRTVTNSKAGEPKIIGGTQSKHNYVLKIQLVSGSNYFTCSGVLIDKQWALTVKHCFDSYNDNPTTISSISNYYDSTSTKFSDSEHMRSGTDLTIFNCAGDSNCPSNSSDLTLIKIKTPYNAVASFLPITTSDSDYNENNSVDVSGWGALLLTTPTPAGPVVPVKYPTTQQTASLKIGSSSVANLPLNSFIIKNYDGWFWDKCISDGDSGGPTIYKNKLIGVISLTSSCPAGRSVASRLKDYSGWISAVRAANP